MPGKVYVGGAPGSTFSTIFALETASSWLRFSICFLIDFNRFSSQGTRWAHEFGHPVVAHRLAPGKGTRWARELCEQVFGGEHAPKARQDAPRRLQDAPKTPQRRAKTRPKRAYKPQVARRCSQDACVSDFGRFADGFLLDFPLIFDGF